MYLFFCPCLDLCKLHKLVLLLLSSTVSRFKVGTVEVPLSVLGKVNIYKQALHIKAIVFFRWGVLGGGCLFGGFFVCFVCSERA